jgi:cytochrome b561
MAKGESRWEMKKPKIIIMVLLVLLFALFLFLFLRFGTCFFVSMNNPLNPVPMFGRNASLYYSLLFLAMIACEVIGYAARFINRSRWLDLIKNFIILILIQFIWNSPVKADFVKIPGMDLYNSAVAIVLIITIIVAFKFFRSLILAGIRQFTLKNKS